MSSNEPTKTSSLATRLISRFMEMRYFLIVAALALLLMVVIRATPFADAALALLLIGTALIFIPRDETKTPAFAAKPKTAHMSGPMDGSRRLTEAFDEPVFLIDEEGNLTHANNAAEKSFGAWRMGAPFVTKMRDPDIARMIQAALALKKSGSCNYFEKHPAEREYSVTVAPVHFGPTNKSEAYIRDGRGKVDYFMIRFVDRTEFQRTDTMRTDFVANASHELRTPLASLSGFIETLRGPARNDAEARDRFLDVMQAQTDRMSRLVDDLLSLSRIEMKVHRQPTKPVDLCEVVHHVMDAMTPVAREQGVELVLHCNCGDKGAVILGERDDLIQVLDNLVDNAIKYGQSGGRVEITVAVDEGSESLYPVSISVRDFGDGIDREHLPRLTERFYRADVEDSRKKKGTGLGLAIVKHLMTRHRGRLDIESKRGHGATFILRFTQDAIPKDLSEQSVEVS